MPSSGCCGQFPGRQPGHDPAGPGDDSPLGLPRAGQTREELGSLRGRIRRTAGNIGARLPRDSILGRTRMEYGYGRTPRRVSASAVAYLDRLADADGSIRNVSVTGTKPNSTG